MTWLKDNSKQGYLLNGKEFSKPNFDTNAFTDLFSVRKFRKNQTETDVSIPCSEVVLHAMNGIFQK